MKEKKKSNTKTKDFISTNSQGYRAGHLRIINLTLEDAGIYECVAKTPVAKIAISTSLTIHGPPGPPGE